MTWKVDGQDQKASRSTSRPHKVSDYSLYRTGTNQLLLYIDAMCVDYHPMTEPHVIFHPKKPSAELEQPGSSATSATCVTLAATGLQSSRLISKMLSTIATPVNQPATQEFATTVARRSAHHGAWLFSPRSLR